jgi:DNA-directed RNA polymerase sigma subunit (sigma70/sigma32)
MGAKSLDAALPDLANELKSAHLSELDSELLGAFEAAGLTKRQTEVITLRFGLDKTHKKRTLDEVAEELNITRECVRQHETKGIGRLRRNSDTTGVSELREYIKD